MSTAKRAIEEEPDRADTLKAEMYLNGYMAGLRAYSWWRNGVLYVGSCGTTLKQAEEIARREILDGR